MPYTNIYTRDIIRKKKFKFEEGFKDDYNTYYICMAHKLKYKLLIYTVKLIKTYI